MAARFKAVEATTARLIARILLDKLESTKFGLLAKELPPFDVQILLEGLRPHFDKMRLAFLGFGDLPADMATQVETVINWRNDPDVTNPIVVFLNAVVPIEKTHSLEMLEPLTDAMLRRAIIKLAQAESQPETAQRKLWDELGRVRTERSLPLVARQVAELYHDLQSKPIWEALPCLNLLPDPSLARHVQSVEEFTSRLRMNKDHVTWLNELDGKDARNLARVLSNDDHDFRTLFRKIQHYAQNPTRTNLSALTLDAVHEIRHAKKAPLPPSLHPQVDVQPTDRESDEIATLPDLVDQLLNLNPHDSNYQEAITQLEHQADRISDLFHETLQDNYNEDVAHTKEKNERYNDAEDRSEIFYNVQSNQELGSVKRPTQKNELHPLDDYMPIWVHPQCWGGRIEVDALSNDVTTLLTLFQDDSLELPLSPLNPLDESQNDKRTEISLINLGTALDRLTGASSKNLSLRQLLLRLHKHRSELTAYRSLFLYYPDQAVQSRKLGRVLRDYLSTYDQFAQQLQQVCRQVNDTNPDACKRAMAQFLALDCVIVTVHSQSNLPEHSVVLTPLHPLHLWKWLKLNDLLLASQGSLDDQSVQIIRNAVTQLPTLLNTFLLHQYMFVPPQQLIEDRFVLAGTVNNPTSNMTIGVPYYQPIAYQQPTDDGLVAFVASLEKFLLLYPPTRLGLTLILIDPPPQFSSILRGLLKLYKDDRLDGAKVFVYYTDHNHSVYDFEAAKNDEALRLIREDPHWELHINLKSLSYEKIAETIREGNHNYPHVVLVCDPSRSIVQPTFRSVQEAAHPFGVPVQVLYDDISDEIKLVAIAGGEIFDTYDGLRNVLSDGLSSSVMSVSSRSIKTDSLRDFLGDGVQANWLAIIDHAQGTLQVPTDIGRRLMRQYVGSRTLAIHTHEADWQSYWHEELTSCLRDMQLSGYIETDILLERLLELFPIVSDGMLKLVRASIGDDYHKRFDPDVLRDLLGLIVVLNWYRRQYEGAILLRLDDDFADWYEAEKDATDYAALWLDRDGLHADILTVQTQSCTYRNLTALPGAKQSLSTLARFADTLIHALTDINLIGPIRRAILRERLTAAVFSTPSSGDGSLLSQTHQTKKQWEVAINRLGSVEYLPHLCLLNIRVALLENKAGPDLSQSFKREEDDYKRIIARLPGSYLDIAKLAKTSVLHPETEEQPVEDLSQPKEESKPVERSDSKLAQQSAGVKQQMEVQAAELRRVLIDYGIAIAGVDVAKSQIGPRFIRYWIKLQPPAGRLSEMQKYAEDIARELGSRTVLIIDNIPGERYVGIDLAREEPTSVLLIDGLKVLPQYQMDQLIMTMGENVAGEAVQLDLAELPHMLVAGQTGSGKTVFLSSVITSLVWQHSVETLQLILVDPKQTDFAIFGNLPHLRDHRIVYEPEEAITILQMLLQNDRVSRTEQLRAARCPDIHVYNERNLTQPMPWIVVVIDEFADLMLSLSRRERNEFERQVNRLAATGRNVGIRLVIATQRPTVDVITGTIKANIPARVSFRLPSQIDSRTILDRPGAENLLGQGDMLVLANGNIQRLQGYYASYEEFLDLLNQVE